MEAFGHIKQDCSSRCAYTELLHDIFGNSLLKVLSDSHTDDSVCTILVYVAVTDNAFFDIIIARFLMFFFKL